MIFSETVYENSLETGLEALGRRAASLSIAHQFEEPVRCTLYDLQGELLAVFGMARGAAEFQLDAQTLCERSERGARLVLQDAENHNGEVILKIDKIQ
jgi:hypothetical protein